jgi:hypothetical protein
MTQPENSGWELLSALSKSLDHGIQNARIEARRATEQLEQLIYSKGLVDESLNLLGTANSPGVQTAAEITLFPSGSLLFPIAEQFSALPAGAPRSNASSQIYSSLQVSVSAFVGSIQSNTPEASECVAKLRQKLEEHGTKIQDLESRLKERLEPYADHLVSHLDGAISSFREAANPARFTNTATLLRELQREFLADVSPDELVEQAPWFVPNEDLLKQGKNGVTRRHRIEFAIFKNLKKDQFPASFAEQANHIAGQLLKDIERLSAYTHVTETILLKDMSDAGPLFASVMHGLLMLISAIESSRKYVNEDIAAEIGTKLDRLFTEDFFNELDQLSTHTRPQGACDIAITKLTFDETTVYFEGTGTVECELQWGSDGDVRRGDGLEGAASFPFTFSGQAEIADISRIEIDRDSIALDTSSFDENEDE